MANGWQRECVWRRLEGGHSTTLSRPPPLCPPHCLSVRASLWPSARLPCPLRRQDRRRWGRHPLPQPPSSIYSADCRPQSAFGIPYDVFIKKAP